MTRPPSPVDHLKAAVVAALIAAAVSSLAIGALYARDPGVRLEMADTHRPVITGLFLPERSEQRTFAWSGETVRIVLAGADRSVPWACEAMVINWRSPDAGPASVHVTSDGQERLATTVSAPEAVLAFSLPPSSAADALDATIRITPTFRPGPRDPRELGLAFDWIRCAPADGARAWPPAALLARGALAAATLGVAIGLTGVPVASAAVLAAAAAVVHGTALTLGLAPFAPALPPVLMLGLLVSVLFMAPVWVLDVTGWRTLSPAARLAVAWSATACYLKLAFILHPDKPLVDAVFHAHRFEAVLDGHFYFTQLSTSATSFPYAIGLYLFAAPWSLLTHDHVWLLRIVVHAAEAGAGLLLYAMLARAWQARAAGVVAVVLFHLVPLPYAVIGNANLTNAFGQSASLATLGAATLWTLAPRRYSALIALSLLAALAFISHISVVVLLGTTLALWTAASWWAGDGDTRVQARGLLLATVLGAMLAVAVYWGHFGDVYAAQLARTRVGAIMGITAPAQAAAPAVSARPGAKPRRVFTYQGVDVARQASRDFGWPVLTLAVVGLWEFLRERRRDRLAWLITTLVAVAAVFLAAGAVAPIDERMQQDAWEFLGRVELATYVAVVILGAVGAVRAWQAGFLGRAAAAVLIACALLPAASAIRAWFP